MERQFESVKAVKAKQIEALKALQEKGFQQRFNQRKVWTE